MECRSSALVDGMCSASGPPSVCQWLVTCHYSEGDRERERERGFKWHWTFRGCCCITNWWGWIRCVTTLIRKELGSIVPLHDLYSLNVLIWNTVQWIETLTLKTSLHSWTWFGEIARPGGGRGTQNVQLPSNESQEESHWQSACDEQQQHQQQQLGSSQQVHRGERLHERAVPWSTLSHFQVVLPDGTSKLLLFFFCLLPAVHVMFWNMLEFVCCFIQDNDMTSISSPISVLIQPKY